MDFPPGQAPPELVGSGDPLDRDVDEFGGTLALGYLSGPITLLLTGAGFHRDIETERREFINPLFFNVVEGDFSSDGFSVEFGGGYRFDFDFGSLQPFASIGYRREEVDDYRETLGGFFFDEDVLTLDPDAPLEDAIDGEADFVSAEPFPEDVITTRRFNGQTIESIPLTVGALISLPVPPPSGGIDLSGARFGLSYTHDFDDQERAVIGVPIGANRIPSFALRAEEQNRNQDLVTISASVDLDLFGVATASLGYERDQGFDERTSADSVRLLFRVPLGLSGS